MTEHQWAMTAAAAVFLLILLGTFTLLPWY